MLAAGKPQYAAAARDEASRMSKALTTPVTPGRGFVSSALFSFTDTLILLRPALSYQPWSWQCVTSMSQLCRAVGGGHCLEMVTFTDQPGPNGTRQKPPSSPFPGRCMLAS